MPLQSVVIESARLVVTRATGVLHLSDLWKNRDALLADSAFDAGFDHLFDLRGAERIAFSSEEVEQAVRVRAFSETSKRAVVAPKDIAFGLARMYEAHRNELSDSVQVFRDLEDALEWLGRDPEEPALKAVLTTVSPTS